MIRANTRSALAMTAAPSAMALATLSEAEPNNFKVAASAVMITAVGDKLAGSCTPANSDY